MSDAHVCWFNDSASTAQFRSRNICVKLFVVIFHLCVSLCYSIWLIQHRKMHLASQVCMYVLVSLHCFFSIRRYLSQTLQSIPSSSMYDFTCMPFSFQVKLRKSTVTLSIRKRFTPHTCNVIVIAMTPRMGCVLFACFLKPNSCCSSNNA